MQTTTGLPQFCFKLTINQMEAAFQEISGLDNQPQAMEYRAGHSATFATVKMPGLQKAGNMTLRKGVFGTDDPFLNWFDQIKINTIPRSDATIALMNAAGQTLMCWKLTNAWPTKIMSTDLKADTHQITIESLELAYESLSVIPA